MNESLHYLLMADHLLFQKSLMLCIKDTDLTLGQPKVLDYLLYCDGAVQKDIAEACHIEPATLTSVLLGMEKKGLIIRKNLNGNRRSLFVYMTDKGKMIANQVKISFAKIEEKALNGFSGTEREMIIDFLKRINKNIYEKEVVNNE